MKYNGLVTYPWERTTVTYPYVWWDDAFTTEEIDKLAIFCKEHGKMEVAGTINDSGESVTDNPVRNSDISFFEWNNDLDWFFRTINNIIGRMNDRWFGFELNGFNHFQYTEYHAESKGHYGWHMDMCMGKENLPKNMHEPRKLSFSLCLNQQITDYKGGDFQINMGRECEPKTMPQQKGRILAFPSWMLHQVTPVTEGVRKSIVIWVTGPKFI